MRTVLFIDDDAQFRQTAAEYFEANGWHVLQASDGQEGIQQACAHQPQAILCDLLMPRGNGFQVCRELRRRESLKDTRILVISGRAFESDRQAALEAGADGYVTKPVDLGHLLLLLSRAEVQNPAPRSVVLTPPSDQPVRLKFWGVRGSIPTPGPGTIRYGGNTSCVEVRADGRIILLDAGTGLRLCGRELLTEFAHEPLELTLLLTHTHWDHIQGLPFFLPLLRRQHHLRILGYEGARQGLANVLKSQMESPFFPVGMNELSGAIRVEELNGFDFSIGPVRVQATFANHPGICVGYRLWTSHGSIAFFPDNEPPLGRERWPQAEAAALEHARGEHRKMMEFVREADVLIMDTQYDCEEYVRHAGWGHGCLDDVVTLAAQAHVKRLLLFHHDPDHDDAKLDGMVAHAQSLAAQSGSGLKVEAAREGEALELNRAKNP